MLLLTGQLVLPCWELSHFVKHLTLTQECWRHKYLRATAWAFTKLLLSLSRITSKAAFNQISGNSPTHYAPINGHVWLEVSIILLKFATTWIAGAEGSTWLECPRSSFLTITFLLNHSLHACKLNNASTDAEHQTHSAFIITTGSLLHDAISNPHLYGHYNILFQRRKLKKGKTSVLGLKLVPVTVHNQALVNIAEWRTIVLAWSEAALK